MSTYADAGVDIDKGNAIVSRIKNAVRSTHTARVLSEIGLFGGLFDSTNLAQNPVLVSSIDGVGTKLHVAVAAQKFHNIGRDIVAHCCDDIVVQGARPLFFLDYVAAANLDENAVCELIEGMTEECRLNGCALLGGETAEMPGTYCSHHYDVVGCIVGVVDKDNVIDGTRIQPGDHIIGLASSGLHTNGYSLARKVLLKDAGLALNVVPDGCDDTLANLLLKPHRSYAPLLLALREKCVIHGLAHITGGGLVENIPRILPEKTAAHISTKKIYTPAIFSLIRSCGNVDQKEMYRVFNMGIGMTVICSPDDTNNVISHAHEYACDAALIGEITDGNKNVILDFS